MTPNTGEKLTTEQIQAFERDGFLHIPGFLSEEQVTEIRAAVKRHFEEKSGTKAGQGVYEADIADSMAELKWMLDYEPVLTVAQQLVGEDVLHPYESAVHMGTVSRGWHKDARDYSQNNPNGSDWSDDYRVLHFAYYLQDHTDYSGGAGFKRGSHRIKNHIEGEPVVPHTRAGDLIIFDLRTTHTGNTLRLKPAFRWIPQSMVLPIPWARFYKRILQPKRLLQAVLMKFQGIFLPAHKDRIAIFFVYGANNQHTANFFEYLKARPDYSHLKKYDGPLKLKKTTATK